MPRSMLMWAACAATWGHIDICSPGCCWRPCLGPRSWCNWGSYWCPWPLLPSGLWRCLWSLLLQDSMLISVGFAAAESHIDVGSLCSHLGTCWCLLSVCGLCVESFWYPWAWLLVGYILMFCARLSLKAMFMVLACPSGEDYKGVCCLCFSRWPF